MPTRDRSLSPALPAWGTERRSTCRRAAGAMKSSVVSPSTARATAPVADRTQCRRMARRAGVHRERRRRALAEAEAGTADPGAAAGDRRLAGRAELALEPGAELFGAAQPAGEVVADMGDRERARRGREQVVEGDDAGVGGRHGEPLADVVERPFAHPADAILDGMESRQESRAGRAPPGRRGRSSRRARCRAWRPPAGRAAPRRPSTAARSSAEGSAPCTWMSI